MQNIVYTVDVGTYYTENVIILLWIIETKLPKCEMSEEIFVSIHVLVGYGIVGVQFVSYSPAWIRWCMDIMTPKRFPFYCVFGQSFKLCDPKL